MTLDERIKAFLLVSSGYSSGYGCGDGYSNGSGYVHGSGSGSGYGSGSGRGSGSGSGYGSGSGRGDGYGSGYGDGYGSGYGSSSGDGIKSVNREMVYQIDGVNTLIRSVRGNTAHGAILNDDLTITPCYIVKQDGVFAHGETLRKAMGALRDKLFEDMPEDERIEKFIEETDPKKTYPARYFYDWHHRLTGSCELGRKQFADNHGYNLDKDKVTLHEFLELTKDAYGGDVIRKVIDRME